MTGFEEAIALAAADFAAAFFAVASFDFVEEANALDFLMIGSSSSSSVSYSDSSYSESEPPRMNSAGGAADVFVMDREWKADVHWMFIKRRSSATSRASGVSIVVCCV